MPIEILRYVGTDDFGNFKWEVIGEDGTVLHAGTSTDAGWARNDAVRAANRRLDVVVEDSYREDAPSRRTRPDLIPLIDAAVAARRLLD